MFRLMWMFVGLVVWLCAGKSLYAADGRLALLVANEMGWGKEARLKGAISGDLKPFAQILKKKLGFEVITVPNGSADEVRQAFLEVRRRFLGTASINTFLFFYSGHADKTHFHLRQETGMSPLSYREFLSFFLKLQVKRRIALLDACDSSEVIPSAAWQTSGQTSKFSRKGSHIPYLRTIRNLLLEKDRLSSKGFSKKKLDLQSIPMMAKEQISGLHIIASNGNSYHNNKLGASVFTRHFLHGLGGSADNNRDGKITLDELYDYAQLKAKKESGQKMDRLVFFRGSYTFAPHFRSQLFVPPKIKGKLLVSVDDFVLHFHKKTNRALLIPTLNGEGTITIEYKRRCWLQRMFFPSSGKTIMRGLGRAIKCSSLKRYYAEKGAESVFLEAKPQTTPFLASPQHTLSLGAGIAELGAHPARSRGLHLSLLYRWRGLFGLGFEYEAGQPPISYQLHRLLAAAELGYPFRFGIPLELFVGLYARGGVVLGVTQKGDVFNAISLSTGGQVALSYFHTRQWGLRLVGRAGLNHTPVQTADVLSFHWMIRAAGLFRF